MPFRYMQKQDQGGKVTLQQHCGTAGAGTVAHSRAAGGVNSREGNLVMDIKMTDPNIL